MRLTIAALALFGASGSADAANLFASGAGTTSGKVNELILATGESIIMLDDASASIYLSLIEVDDPDQPHTVFGVGVCAPSYGKICFDGSYGGPAYDPGFLNITDTVNRRVLDFFGATFFNNNYSSGRVVIDYANGTPIAVSGQLKGYVGVYTEALYDVSYDVSFAGTFSSVSGNLPPPPVPEPAAWAMMLGGFFAAGSAMRAQRRASIMARLS